jgi:hypothetical protein
VFLFVSFPYINAVENFMKKVLFVWVAVGLLSAACGSTNQAETEAPETGAAPATETAEVAEAPAGEGVAIALISPEDGSLPMGDAELVLHVVDPATNKLIAVEGLQVDLSMEMDGMEPMTTMAVIEPGEEPGQYKVMTNLGMEGMWMMEVTSSDPAMPGEASFSLEVN